MCEYIPTCRSWETMNSFILVPILGLCHEFGELCDELTHFESETVWANSIVLSSCKLDFACNSTCYLLKMNNFHDDTVNVYD